jgi:hypothetical protein
MLLNEETPHIDCVENAVILKHMQKQLNINIDNTRSISNDIDNLKIISNDICGVLNDDTLAIERLIYFNKPTYLEVVCVLIYMFICISDLYN